MARYLVEHRNFILSLLYGGYSVMVIRRTN